MVDETVSGLRFPRKRYSLSPVRCQNEALARCGKGAADPCTQTDGRNLYVAQSSAGETAADPSESKAPKTDFRQSEIGSDRIGADCGDFVPCLRCILKKKTSAVLLQRFSL